MPIDVRMPKLSDNMEEGTIIRWYKQTGDEVTAGETLAEVETDKADVEVEATESGVLREIRVAEGQTASVGDVIAVLGAAGEARSEKPARRSSDGNGTEAETQSAAPERERERSPSPSRPAAKRPASDDGQRASRRASEAPPEEMAPHQVRASTVARRMAEEAGVQIGRVAGSGPGGLILKRDIEAAVSGTRSRQAEKTDGQAPERHAREERDKPTPRADEPPAGAGHGKLLELSRMRATIARRMAEAKRDIPHFYLTSEIDMSEAMRVRQTLKETGTIATLTVTHLIVKALAIALTRHPRVNGSWRDGSILLHEEVHIGIAVAVDDGLIVPVLHNVERLALREISASLLSLTEKARSGRFSGDDLSGATFSLSNLGTLDIEEIAAVINPPQAAILACGAVKERPVARDGALAVAKTMHATLSCDHRVLNGVEGAHFLEELKGLLESPVLLVG